MSTDLISDQTTQTCSKHQHNNSTNTLNTSTVNCDTASDDSKIEVLVLSKSDKTLTKNIDAKDDSLRKRTSLIIVPQKDSPDIEDYSSNNITHNMSSSTIDNENCNELVSDNEKTMEKSSTKSLESSICSNHSATDEEDLNELNKKPLNANKCDTKRQSLASVDSCVSRSNSSATNCSTSTSGSISTSTSSKSSSSGDDVILDEDYQDLENGNIIEDLEAERKNCISNASSCIDDYSLRQKYEEYVVNVKTQDDANNGDTSTDADEGNIEGDDDELAETEAETVAQPNTVQDQRQTTTLLSSSLPSPSSVVREHNEGGLLGSNIDEVDTQPRSLPPCDALLSPQEAPMGRRYAEVAQFKGNKR